MATAILPKGPLWMQNIDYPAQTDRFLFDVLFPNEGVLTGFGVTAGGGLNISVAPGLAVIRGDEVANQGKYVVDSDASVLMTIAAVGVTRTEYVWLAINDPAVSGGRAGNNATIETGPTIPNNSVLLLATLELPAGTATITSAMVTDSRSYTGRRDEVGEITLFAGSRLPFGKLLCDGSAVSRTTYSDLFSQIGTAYGAGNGSTTFNLPDLRGRVPVGKAAAGTFGTEGATGGVESVVLSQAQMPVHSHSDPGHGHSLTGGIGYAGTDQTGWAGTGQTGGAGGHYHTATHDHPNQQTSFDFGMSSVQVLRLSPGGSLSVALTGGSQNVELVDLRGYTYHGHNTDLPNHGVNTSSVGDHTHSGPNHTHAGPNHTHPNTFGITGVGAGLTGNAGGDTAHTNLQPYQVVMGYVISF